MFGGHTFFNNAKFKGDANFNYANFGSILNNPRKVEFYYSNFDGEVAKFEWAKFKGDAVFKWAEFEEYAHFQLVRFENW
jgi:uncharacterized protein YjbI with pentapeptide repeats